VRCDRLIVAGMLCVYVLSTCRIDHSDSLLQVLSHLPTFVESTFNCAFNSRRKATRCLPRNDERRDHKIVRSVDIANYQSVAEPMSLCIPHAFRTYQHGCAAPPHAHTVSLMQSHTNKQIPTLQSTHCLCRTHKEAIQRLHPGTRCCRQAHMIAPPNCTHHMCSMCLTQLSFCLSSRLVVVVVEGASSPLPDVDEGSSVECVCWKRVGLPRCTMA